MNPLQFIFGLAFTRSLVFYAEFKQALLAGSHKIFFIYLSFVFTGFFFLFFFRRNLLNISGYIRARYVSAALSGAAGLILTPVVFLSLLGTLIGLFLCPAFLAMYCLFLFFAFYSAAALIGELLARLFTFRDHLYIEMFLGVTVLFFSVFVPFAGSLLFVFFLLLGLGGVLATRFGAAD
jgi:hypothetical protein